MIPAILNVITGGLFKTITSLADKYFAREISREQFEAQIAVAQSEAQRAVEVAWTEAAAKMAESVQQTVRASPAIARAYAAVMFLQLAVLAWFQVGVPAYQVITGTPWPAPGINPDYAYLLLAATLGAWPLVRR